jgi:hypothetical protein
MKINAELIIGAAGALGLVSFSSLIKGIYLTHNTTSLPWTWLFISIAAQTLALTYGIIKRAYGLIIPNIFFNLGLYYILYIKLKHPQIETEAEKQL